MSTGTPMHETITQVAGLARDFLDSLATPLDMAVTRDGRTLYVTAYGSSRIGVFDTAEVEADIKRLGRNAMGDFGRYLNVYSLPTTRGVYEGQRNDHVQAWP